MVSKMRSRRFDLGAALLASMLLILPFTSFADAQTKKKKKVHRTVSTTQSSTSSPPTGDPTVVSRASDYQDSNAIINPGAEPSQAPVTESERDRQLADLSARIKQLEDGMKDGY